MPSTITAAAHGHTPQLCAHCGAILRTDSRAFAPVEYEDGLVCPACDEAAMADAADRIAHRVAHMGDGIAMSADLHAWLRGRPAVGVAS
jgi:hypothetical protein